MYGFRNMNGSQVDISMQLAICRMKRGVPAERLIDAISSHEVYSNDKVLNLECCGKREALIQYMKASAYDMTKKRRMGNMLVIVST